MQLAQVLDVIEALFRVSEHPDITDVGRYGGDAAPGGQSPAGVRVSYESGSFGMLWGAVADRSETPLAIPDVLPPVSQRSARTAILAVQLLDVARPEPFGSWQLVASPNIGPTDQRGAWPAGLSIVCKDGTKVLLRATAGSGAQGDPDEDPAPDYRIPEGVKAWQMRLTVPSAAKG